MMISSSRLFKVLLLVAACWVLISSLLSKWRSKGATIDPDNLTLIAKSARTQHNGGTASAWTATRDRNNHYMTEAQCLSAFPLLYKEIDRAAAYWKSRPGKISTENIDLSWSWDGGLRCVIYDQQLYITYSRGLNHFDHWIERHRATLQNIHRAIITAPEPVPNIAFSIKIDDDVNLTERFPNATCWVFARNIHDPIHEQLWVIPDFNFWAYPRVAGSFHDFQTRAIEIGNHFRDNIPKLVWRGTLAWNPDVRGPILKQSEGQPWSNVVSVDERDATDNAHIRMEEHYRYKFAAHTEGHDTVGTPEIFA